MAFLFIYPVILILLIGIFLIFWINKDLLIKNIVLLIGGGMLGAIVAAILSFILIESKLSSSRLSTLLFIFFPVTFAIVTLQNVKHNELFDVGEKALLFSQPSLVFKALLYANLISLTLSSLLLMATLGADKIAFAFILMMVEIPVSFIAALLITSFMKEPSKLYGTLLSLLFGATASLLFVTDSVFSIPVVFYAVVIPYIWVYLMVLGREKQLNN